MKRFINYCSYFTVFALILFLVFNLYSHLNYGNNWTGNSFVFNSDALVLYGYCKELIISFNSIFEWNIGTFLPFFPNLLIMCFAENINSAPAWSLFIYGIIQFALLILLFNYLFRILFPEIKGITLSIANMFLALLLVYAISSSDFISVICYLFLPYHTGTFLSAILAIIFLFKYLKNRKNITIIFFTLTLLISIISNPITLLYFSVPVLGAFSLLLINEKIYSRAFLIRMIVVVGLISIAGFILYKVFLSILSHTTFLMTFFNGIEGIKISLKNLFHHYYLMLISGSFMTLALWLGIVSFLFNFFIAIHFVFKSKAKENKEFDFFYIYSIFVTIFTPVVFIAPGITGIYSDYSCIRYNTPVIILTLISIGLNLEYLSKRYKLNKLIIPLIFIVLFTFHLFFLLKTIRTKSPFEALVKIENYYPEIVKATDALSKKYQLKNGLGGYWDAGLITYSSKSNIKVKCVFENLDPYIFYCNINYQYKDIMHKEKMIYNFISLNNISDTSYILNIFDPRTIKRVSINSYYFYLVPDFVLNENNKIEMLNGKTY